MTPQRSPGHAVENREARVLDLLLVMEKRNLLDAGMIPKSSMPEMRWRGPEHRAPRSRNLLGPKRIATALARKAAREAQSTTPGSVA